MGIIRQGILGGFSNKVGAVVGAAYKKLNVIRALPRKSNKPATLAQIAQRSRFGLVTEVLSYISELIETCYKKGSGSTSPMNEAVAYHLKNAVTGTAPNFTLDYTKLRFSAGKLAVPSTFSVDTTAPAKIDFNWSPDGADSKYKDATDVINVMVYNPTKQQFVTLMAAAPRSAGTYVLPMPLEFVGDSVHCFFSFSSTKKKNLHSKSVYVVLIPVA